MTKSILITGSGGFIGGNLKKYLEKFSNYKLYTPRSFELDCTNKKAVKDFFNKNKIDFIVHAGTVGGVRGVLDSKNTVADNITMVENLLEAKLPSARMILFGSGAMYGKQRALHKVNEDKIGEIIPSDLYGESKMLIAQKVENRNDTICLNIFACYGFGELETRFPTYAVKQNIKHLPIIINQDVVFDYLYIDDLLEIIEHFIKNQPQKYNIINVTPTESVKLSDIANIINHISNYKSEIIIKSDHLGNEYTGSNSRLCEEIKDINFTPIKTGLHKLYSEYKNLTD